MAGPVPLYRPRPRYGPTHQERPSINCLGTASPAARANTDPQDGRAKKEALISRSRDPVRAGYFRICPIRLVHDKHHVVNPAYDILKIIIGEYSQPMR